MNLEVELNLNVERLQCANSPAVFWPKRRRYPGAWWITGFNLGQWVVRLWVRVTRRRSVARSRARL